MRTDNKLLETTLQPYRRMHQLSGASRNTISESIIPKNFQLTGMRIYFKIEKNS
ncbi:conserved hypothetical protein [Neorickettsia risticii str. Illinois]|uniref:Uncharacterized protein n=1 Tax=Neorickettsia risticii (strain Illinois) TaxID=434131 RepID=C6V572_NEORI|nr:conserved hypothetical protein [Neorickettsia risticii str. Illinois]